MGVAKDWRRTRGAFTGDEFIKQVFEEGRKIRDAERKRAQSGPTLTARTALDGKSTRWQATGGVDLQSGR
jgi:hypothetical protein